MTLIFPRISSSAINTKNKVIQEILHYVKNDQARNKPLGNTNLDKYFERKSSYIQLISIQMNILRIQRTNITKYLKHHCSREIIYVTSF